MDEKLRRIGEFTTILTLAAPITSFMICHKKSYDMNLMLQQINFKYLLSLLTCNLIWMSYSLRGPSQALLALNVLRVVVSIAYVTIYLYAKTRVKPPEPYLKQLLVALVASLIGSSSLLEPEHVLDIALTLNMTLFVF